MFFVTEDWYFCSHRLELAAAAKAEGYEVSVLTRVQEQGRQIEEAGLRLIPLEISRGGMGPLSELRTVVTVYNVYRTEKPDIVLAQCATTTVMIITLVCFYHHISFWSR